MTSLQLVLLIAGVALILAVVLYNVIQVRSIKSRALSPQRQDAAPPADAAREEPAFRAPTAALAAAPKEGPDFMAEAVLTLQLPEAIAVTTEIAQQILKAPGKRVRILWQPQGAAGWTRLHNAAEIIAFLSGEEADDASVASSLAEDVPPVHSLAFCLQLADRAHIVTAEQLDVFQKHVESIASLLSASYTPFDVALEAERAKALDRACAQLDLQIGLTLHGKVGPLPGQQLLQAAQKLGLALERGALRYQEDAREVYRIESHDGTALTEERLKKAIQNPVILLDVPQVSHPEHSFDEMLKQATKLSQALSAQLVDDRQRLVNEQGLELIRTEVIKAAQAMRDLGIEPGSARALRLFTA